MESQPNISKIPQNSFKNDKLFRTILHPEKRRIPYATMNSSTPDKYNFFAFCFKEQK